MGFRQKPRLILSVIAGVLLVTLGCTTLDIGLKVADVGPLERTSTTIERGDVDRVNATIRMAAGSLSVEGGADDLLDADFKYNVPDWKPEVRYDVTDSVGRLDIRHADSDALPIRDKARNEWDFQFNNDVPIDLRIEIGAGDHDLDLEDIILTDLDVKLGAGDMDLSLGGNAGLERVDLDVGAGDVKIDLAGTWEQDASVDIQGGIGKTTIYLPQNTGVRLSVTQGIGDLDISGLSREGGVWVNDDYGNSDVNLDIDIQAGIGEIRVIGD